MERIRTREGVLRDVEKNVLELCREAFNEAEFLRWEEEYRPSKEDFEDMDIINAKITNFPVLYVWVDSEANTGNETGGLQRSKYGKVAEKKNRNKTDYTVMVLYETHWDLPKEGHKKVRSIGEMLKKKLTENSNLLGIANMGGRVKNMNFDPDLIMTSDGTLQPVAACRIIMEYSLVERQQRAS